MIFSISSTFITHLSIGSIDPLQWVYTLFALLSTASTTIPITTTGHDVSSTGQQVFVPCYLVTFQLPEVPYLPKELAIISSLTPNDAAPIIISNISSQHTVRFCDLSTGVEYSYTIRIALRSDTNIGVVDSLMGTFTISKCMGVCLRFFRLPKWHMHSSILTHYPHPILTACKSLSG